MASNYTRYIEFKVKGQELTRAVDRIFKGENKIEIGVEKVNTKAKITGDVIKEDYEMMENDKNENKRKKFDE